MTPNFALSLSFEGIRLLHRVPDGWHLVGEVALDHPEFNTALADLRMQAETLEPAGITSKLVIPAAQIKFTTIETAQTKLEDIHAALDGATPYAIDELVIDFDRNGGRTHIAAVARETLEEAENFATEHGFNPVCFVAEGEALTFQQEVFFGPASAVSGDMPSRESVPVIETGQVETDQPATDVGEVSDNPFDGDAPDGAGLHNAEADVVFASRSKPTAAPIMAPPTAPATQVVQVAQTDDEPEPIVEPSFTRRKTEPPLAVPVAVVEGPSVATPSTSVPDAPDREVIAKIPETRDAPALTGKHIEEADADTSFAALRAVRKKREIAPKPTSRQSKKAEEQAAGAKMAVFGTPERSTGKPRFFALKLTAALLAVLLLIALWANSWTEDGVAGWFNETSETAVARAAPQEQVTAEVIAAAPSIEMPAPSALAPVTTAAVSTDSTPPLPVVRAATGRILSPSEANRIYAATGVYQRAPRLPLTPRETSLSTFEPSAIITSGQRPDQLAMPDMSFIDVDAPLAVPRNPPPAGAIFQRDLRGHILATAEGVLTPDGAFVVAGRPASEPPLRPGTVIISAPDPAPVAANGEGIVLIAGRPAIVPPLRPEELAPNEISSPVEAPAEIIAPQATQDSPAAIADDAPLLTPQAADARPQVALAAPEPPSKPEASAQVEEQVPLQGDAPLVTDATVSTSNDAGAAPEGSNVISAVTPNQLPTGPEASGGLAQVSTPTVAGTALNLVAGKPDVIPPRRPASFATIAPKRTDESPEIEGLNLIEGRPAVEPLLRPAAFAALEPAQDTPVVLADRTSPLAGLRPTARAASFQAAAPAAVGSDPQLAGLRPNLRPRGLAPATTSQTPGISAIVAAIAQAAPTSNYVDVTPRAVRISARPGARPRNFDRVVKAARTRAPQRSKQTTTRTVASATVKPTGPVPGGVARAATIGNAINLHSVSLIGVYGRPNARRALVRMGNGRFVKVEVGSRLDGGRVSAIGDNALNYVKGGRTYALQLPNS